MLVALKRYPLQVNLLLGGTFLLTMGRAITLPYLVIYLSTQFGLPVSRIGLIMGGALFGGSLLSLYGGFLIDRMPGFRLILGFGSCFVAAFAGMLLTSQLWLFFLFLLGFNFAYSVTDVVVKTLFGRLLPAGEQGRAFSVRYTLINLAYAIGPFIGAALAQWHTNVPFVVSAALGGLFLLAFLRYGDRSMRPAQGTAPPSFIAVMGVLAKDQRLMSFTIGGVLTAVVFGQFSAYLSQYLVATGTAEYAYQVIQTLLGVNAVTVIALQYLLGKRIGNEHLQRWLIVGLGLFVLGIIGFGLSHSLWHWGLAMVVFTLGEIIVIPAEYMFIDRIAPPHLRGIYYGTQNLANLGGAFGPILVGWFLALFAPHWVFVMLGAFIIGGGVFYVIGSSLGNRPTAGP
ncbi:MFS transporter [Pseudomonas nitroreducens]|uniref:MFS transporter n=1 Tax=Pseudomonas nitroreducens TaxID=46680 RepID=UPI0014744922|nr:MFS transporter [Pseudomonas nitroreducens]MDG9857809.1 MFS transporter [Pseudomonas nitroreducens]MDH1076207.1 MFS transporter [Pseudomonas nitroreducens]NMZ73579.1 MFS transporter [Pseudomonas nitroreducens]